MTGDIDDLRESAATRAGSPTSPFLSRVADACALLTAALGLLVMAGWVLDVEPLKRVLPGLVAMKFNAALAFALAGAGLWWRKRPPLRLSLGALVALLGGSTLCAYLGGLDLGIDQLFVRDLMAGPEASFPPGRMAPSTALCFLVLGLALMGAGPASKWTGYAAELLALAATVIGGLSLVAYPTGAVYLRQLPGSISMALPTAAAFVVLGVGILCAAEGIVVRSMRPHGMGRALWVGFGVLTCLLAGVGVVFTVNLQTLADDLHAQANVARPRREAALELESRVLGYGLAVRLALAGDPQARQAASSAALGLDRHLAEYEGLASTDRQRQLAARLAAQWREVADRGASLLGAEGPPSQEELARFAALRARLVELLEAQIRPEAVEAFEARRAITLRDLRATGDLPLLLLVVSLLLALVTSGAVARAVRKQEQTVREQREWLRVTLSSIGDAVVACDTERRVTFLNPVAEALTGWRTEEALGQPIATVLRLVNEQTGEPGADIAEQVLREGRVVALANHTALVTRDGREVPIEDSAAPIADLLGKVAGAVIVFHDVTERRHATEQLKQSEARLSRSQEIAHLGSWELDLARNRLTWSDEVYRIFGLQPQQFGATYEAFLDAVHPDDRAAVDGAYSGSVREGRDSYEIEHRVVRRSSGEVRTVHEKCQHFRDGAGRIVRSVGMVHDVTERKQAEEALQESERRVRLKLESILSPSGDPGSLELGDLIDAEALQSQMESFYKLSGIPVGIIDSGGKVLVGVGWQDVCTRFHRVNPETCRHCVESDTQLTAGVSEGEHRIYKCKNNMWDAATPIVVGGRHVGNIFTGQFFFDDEQVDHEVFRAQAKRFGFVEAEYLSAIGRVPRLSRSAVQEGMAFYAKLAHMLSKLSYGNLALARALADRDRLTASLQEADQRKNEFLAMLSHELRNPLAPIRNSLHLLERAAPGGDQARRAQAVIDRQVGHLSRLVDDLLDVTRIERNKIRLERQVLDLHDLVRRTVEDHRSLFEKSEVQLEVRLEPERVSVSADGTRLAQVIGNLLQNAAKFTGPGGRTEVSVCVDSAERQAVIRVSDTGVGLPPELLGRLFLPFMQADATLDRSKGGLGLGLALVKGLVELHGGGVCARSDGPGRGAEFVVRLPLAVEGAATAEPCRANAQPAGRRVLIIEDNVDAADSLRDVLELAAHEVAVAYNGPEGLAKARELHPEIVLCDIGLPGMDGFEIARAFKADENLRACFLIALSGYALPEDLQRASEAGFERHLAKPLSLERLEELLESLPRPALSLPSGPVS
ncbi:MAG: PocR ligand-binding domain-containing protein [Deltaproteobacteria bacterium]|nr:PocR ligand-binding domain-containing protein [Deltaproteobacteria bacterium]